MERKGKNWEEPKRVFPKSVPINHQEINTSKRQLWIFLQLNSTQEYTSTTTQRKTDPRIYQSKVPKDIIIILYIQSYLQSSEL